MTSAAQRKQLERERKRQAGDVTLTLTLTKEAAERLAFVCDAREYDKAELVALLIHRDWQKVSAITEGMGVCDYCGEQLPKGCKGQWKGLGQCFKTVQQREVLSL